MKTVYLLLVSKKGGYHVHSLHVNKETAQHWKDCLESSGDDCSIAQCERETLVDFLNSPGEK